MLEITTWNSSWSDFEWRINASSEIYLKFLKNCRYVIKFLNLFPPKKYLELKKIREEIFSKSNILTQFARIILFLQKIFKTTHNFCNF